MNPVEKPAGPEPIVTWTERQVAKVATLAAVLIAAGVDDNAARIIGTVIAIAGFVLEFLHSRAAELTRREALTRLRSANDVCRSLHAVTERKGIDTHWPALQNILTRELAAQHRFLTTGSGGQRKD